jgi:hypothetical protein
MGIAQALFALGSIDLLNISLLLGTDMYIFMCKSIIIHTGLNMYMKKYIYIFTTSRVSFRLLCLSTSCEHS